MATKAANARQRFLMRHPICCYCGGKTPATTEDHWPSRSIFDDRRWPENYKFPACHRCNSATSGDETLFALVCRMAPANKGQTARAATKRLIDALRETHPEVMRSLVLDKEKAREWWAEQGVRLPAGTLPPQLPLISLEHPQIYQSAKRCIAKLFLSLHYLHTKVILPPSGKILFRWDTNATLPKETAIVDLAKNLPYQNFSKRGTIDLSKQFVYRFNADSENGRSVFVASIHQGMLLTALVAANPAELFTEPESDDAILSPFNWT